MINNIPQPDTYKKDYLEAASRVRVSTIQKDSLSDFKPVKKSIAKEVSSQIKIKIPTVKIPTVQLHTSIK